MIIIFDLSIKVIIRQNEVGEEFFFKKNEKSNGNTEKDQVVNYRV